MPTIEQEIAARSDQYELRDQIRRNEFRAMAERHKEEYSTRVKRLEEVRLETSRVDEAKTDDVRKVQWLIEQENLRHKQELARLSDVLSRTQVTQIAYRDKHSLLLQQMEKEVLALGADQKNQENHMLFDHLYEKQQEDAELNALMDMKNNKQQLLEAAQRYRDEQNEKAQREAAGAAPLLPQASRPISATEQALSQAVVLPEPCGPLLKDKLGAIGVLKKLDALIGSNQNGGLGTRDAFFRDLDDFREVRAQDVSECIVSEEELRAEFQRWDCNNDGSLDENEFLTKVVQMPRWGAPPVSREEACILLHRTTSMGQPKMSDKRITFEEFSVFMLSFRRR